MLVWWLLIYLYYIMDKFVWSTMNSKEVIADEDSDDEDNHKFKE